MTFAEIVRILHDHDTTGSAAFEFVVMVIDAILEEAAIEDESKEANPIAKKARSTKEAIYAGTRHISKRDAATIYGHISEERFISFFDNYSNEALENVRDRLAEHGFDVPAFEVPQACGNIIAQAIRMYAEGTKPVNVTSLNYVRRESGKLIRDIAPATIEKVGNKLRIAGEEIIIHQELVPEEIAKKELAYITALYEVLAEKLKKESFSEDDIPGLPRRYSEQFKEQRMAYYNAISIEHTVRDIFETGDDEFQRLKDDEWHGINTTYWADFPDGYARLNAVLDKATNTSLDGTVLSQIRHLIDNLTKKGICHILVNDGVIKSWVNVDE